MTKDKATATWTDEVPTKGDAGDAYYFVRRKDKLDVVIMGFSMGKGWLNGVSYEASEMRNHLFLGPITPDLFAEVARLREVGEASVTLLRSLIPRLCVHCQNDVFPLREWSGGKAFTHWSGYEQLACAASDVRIFLARAALSSGKE